MGNNELLHWGILGMKWGRRRFQNKDGSLTPEGRKRYADDENEETEEERAKREAAEKAYREEVKKRVIKSGDLDRIDQWKSEMTNQELREALDRVDLHKRLYADDPNTKSAFDKGMDAVDKIGKVKNAADTLVNVYNLVAKINNSFNKKFQLIKIDDSTREVVDSFKEKLINTASAKEVMENIDKLNASEISTAKKRLNNIDNISKMAAGQTVADDDTDNDDNDSEKDKTTKK